MIVSILLTPNYAIFKSPSSVVLHSDAPLSEVRGARVTFSAMSEALAVQRNGLGGLVMGTDIVFNVIKSGVARRLLSSLALQS
jgi:hypothetical protein